MITAVQIGCGELPPLAPPQSSRHQADESEDLTTQFTTVWTPTTRPRRSCATSPPIRAIVPDPDAQGLRAYVTGEAAFAADQAAALEGIDETLLAVTLVLILLLLLYLPLPGARARAAVRRRHRLPRRRRHRLRAARRPAPSRRPARPRRS